jgi:hypothetical protein
MAGVNGGTGLPRKAARAHTQKTRKDASCKTQATNSSSEPAGVVLTEVQLGLAGGEEGKERKRGEGEGSVWEERRRTKQKQTTMVPVWFACGVEKKD